MNVSVQSYREGDHASLVLTGPFDLAHATAVEWEVENAQASLGGCASVDIDLPQLDRIDGAGAVLLARLLDRLDADGRHASVVEGSNRKAARLIGLYRERKSNRATPQQMRTPNSLTRIGALAARLPGKVHDALAFTGRFAVALPKAAAAPSSVDWRSLPRLIQEFGADACQLRRPHTPPIRMVEPQLLEPQQSEDPVWLWSSAPDRYLDTALHLEVASNPNVRLVDSGRATSLAATLLVWDLESAQETRLVGVVEFQITGPDRAVHTQLVRASEPVSSDLPGNLAVAAGRLLRHLASEGLTLVATQP